VEFIPERQGWFNTGKSITEICHTDRKTKPHIISTEKEFDKTQLSRDENTLPPPHKSPL
jgi:hypothetical protein